MIRKQSLELILPHPDIKEWDIVRVYPVPHLDFVEIEGAVQKPGSYKLLKNMRLSDLVFISTLDTAAELKHIELFRKSPLGGDEILSLNLDDILRNPSSTQNILLSHQDRVFIRYIASLKKLNASPFPERFNIPVSTSPKTMKHSVL